MAVTNHWPGTLLFIRHGESQYNVLRERYPRDVVARMVATEAGRAELEELFASLPSDAATPLTDAGRAQAIKTGRALRERGWQANRIYVSPYYRTRETVILVANELTRASDAVVVSPYSEQERWMIREYSGYELPAIERHVAFDSEEHEALGAGRDSRRYIELVEDSRVREREFGVATLPTKRDAGPAADHRQREVLERFDAHFSRPEAGESLEDVKTRVREFIGHLTRKPRGQHMGVVTHSHTIMCARAVLEKKLFRIPEVLLHVDHTDWVRTCAITSYELESGTLRLRRYNEVLY